MALKMVKLERDPKVGSWRSRKVIPQDVRAAYGKANEVGTWPATLTPAQVKGEWRAWLDDVEARIEQLRQMAQAAPVTLTHKQITALAGAWYRRQAETYEDNPGDPRGWEAMLDELEAADLKAEAEALVAGEEYTGGFRRVPRLERELDALLDAERLKVDARTREALLDQMHTLFVPLCHRMIRRAAGDYGSDQVQATLPAWEGAAPAITAKPAAVSIIGLFDGYVTERKPAAATVKAWRRQIERLKEFLGHDDATQVTPRNMVAWKDALLAQGLSAKTVGETYLSAARTVFGYGKKQHQLTSNPAADVTVVGPKKVKLRNPGLTDAEAKTILQATLKGVPAGLSAERTLAYRWVPWLCAYTGARVNEMTQLRREDVYQADGVWVVLITPEAGSTKNSEAREVPVHPHLVEQGFLEVIEKARPGPLFYDPKRHRGGKDGNPQSKKVGEALARWVRDIGVNDPNVQPNHGWRHRWKTVARLVEIDAETRDAIQGHKPRTEGEGYGVIPVAVKARAIKKLPRYDVRA